MSSSILHTIPLRNTGYYNKLYLDYIDDPPAGIGGCLQGFSQEASFWRELAEASERMTPHGRESLWGDVLQDVMETSNHAGASQEILAKLEKARDRRVLFVITGQQPALLGGPLLTVYKAFTAVTFADWLQSALSIPAIPLFWIAADDSDFSEIRSLSMLTADLSSLTVSLSNEAHHPGMPVGDIGIRFVSEAWASMSTFVDAFPASGRILEWISRPLAHAGDHAQVFASILSSLAGGRLAFVDGRSRPLRRFSRQLFSDYLEREEEIKLLVADRGGQLRRNGYHAQLIPGKDSGIFMLEDGERRSVPPDRISILRAAIDHSIEHCSPGVILRNLVQDHVFRPIAVVLGPAETAYRAQIVDAYQSFMIPRPAVLPRMSSTFIPPAMAAWLSTASTNGYRSLLREPAQFVSAIYDQSTPAEMKSAIEKYRGQIVRAADGVRRAAAGSITEKLQKRLNGRLAEIERRAEQLREIESEAGKMRALERYPFLSNLQSVIRPDSRPQERVLSCLVPFMFSGEDAGSAVEEASKRHVAELMDGTPCHIVYSA